VVGVLLVAFFKDDKNFIHAQSAVQEVILTLNYAAIILSISATTTALSLTDEFSEIPSRASRNPLHTSAYPAVSFQGENWGILRYFGVRKSTRWFIYHCKSTIHDSIFSITKTMYRVGMLAIGYSLCHRVYYHICCDSREADGYYHLRHHWRRDITPLISFPHTVLDLKTTGLWITPDGNPTSQRDPSKTLPIIKHVKSRHTLPCPHPLISSPSRVRLYTRFAKSLTFRRIVRNQERSSGKGGEGLGEEEGLCGVEGGN